MRTLLLFLCAAAVAADISPLGKQHPYTTTLTVRTTNIVSTVCEVVVETKYLQVIDAYTNRLETNLLMLRSGVVEVKTNSLNVSTNQ